MIAIQPAGDLAPSTPAGGYSLVPLRWLAALWRAYRRGTIRLLDLRAALAAREMAARRGCRAAARPLRFTLDELADLTGSTARNLRGSLSRLDGAALLRWSEAAIEFPPARPGGDPDLDAWVAAIENRERRVPVPRRMLRSLAIASSPVRVATVLGVLFRCAYLRGRAVAARGRIKASWVARTFGVDLRRVKAARNDLVRSGWIVAEEGDRQWAMNRYGRAYAINLEWGGAPTPGGPGLPPPAAVPGPGKTPPGTDRDPLPGVGNQEPAPAGAAGFPRTLRPGDRPPAPDLRRVLPEDLEDTGRALELHRQAVVLGLVAASESGRLRVLAAAEHARAVGRRNPAGLFAALVRRGLWSHATMAAEESASRRLKAHLRGGALRGPAERGPSPPMKPPSPTIATAPSADARLVQAVRSQLRGRGDAYLALRRRSPEWTRARYDLVAAELDARKRPAIAAATELPHGVTAMGTILERLGIRRPEGDR